MQNSTLASLPRATPILESLEPNANHLKAGALHSGIFCLFFASDLEAQERVCEKNVRRCIVHEQIWKFVGRCRFELKVC